MDILFFFGWIIGGAAFVFLQIRVIRERMHAFEREVFPEPNLAAPDRGAPSPTARGFSYRRI